MRILTVHRVIVPHQVIFILNYLIIKSLYQLRKLNIVDTVHGNGLIKILKEISVFE
jgi:hypothetical protein